MQRMKMENPEQIMSHNMDYTWMFRVGCAVVSIDHWQDYIR